MAKPPKKDDTVQSFFEALYAARDSDANEVAQGLFLGAAAAGADKKAMAKRRISHVLIVHPTMPEKFPKDFKYHRAPILDLPNANMLEQLPDALAFLGSARKAGGRPFVYCAKGISRSSTVVIALVMMEQNIGFEEAWKKIEKERPIVYPNVGFQRQLRFLEQLLNSGQVDKDASFDIRVTQLRAAVPRGELQGPKAPIQIADEIGGSMGHQLNEVEEIARKVLTQPQLLQKRELWKRHGLFFENLHKYKALPSEVALIERAKQVAATLKTLPKIFSDSLKGVKLALGVVKELEGWCQYAEPLLRAADKAAKEAAARDAAAGEEGGKPAAAQGDEEADPAAAFLSQAGGGGSKSSSSSDDGGKKAKKSKREKLSKKDKKAAKADKKIAKAEKKAQKVQAKIEKAAAKADKIAAGAREAAEEAAKRAEEVEEEIGRLEAAEDEAAFEQKAAAGGARGGKRRSRSRKRSRSRSRKRGRSSGSSDGGGSEDSGTGICPPPHLRKR